MGRDSDFASTLSYYIGQANYAAGLDANGLVPTAQLGTGATSTTVFLRGDSTWGSAGSSTSFPASITIGTSLSTAGAINLLNATNSNVLTLKSGVTTPTKTFTLPTKDGSLNQSLVTNGAGVLSFATPTTVRSTLVMAGGTYAAGTYFGSGIYGANAQDVSIPVPYAGTLKRLYVRSGATFTGNIAAGAVLNVNASATALVTGALSTSGTTVSDVSDTVAVAAGDLLSLNVSGIAIGDVISSWTLELDG